MYTVYILKSVKFRKTYVGFTNNIERRLNEHNLGKSIYTSRYRPWKIIFKEQYDTLGDARNREKYFKSRSGRMWLKVNLF